MRTLVPISDRYRTGARAGGLFAVEDRHTNSEIDLYRSRAVPKATLAR